MLPWVDKLREIEERYEELSRKLADPSVLQDPTTFQRPAKAHASLHPLVEKYRAHQRLMREQDEAAALLGEATDPEMRALADGEPKALKGRRGALRKLRHEGGAHRVQRVPATEASGRIHTSTVTIAVLPEAEEVDVQIDPKDPQIDVFRASGAGGQHVNVTDSAVRITHIPTGLVVSCQDERSQHKNKAKALKVLRARLLERAGPDQYGYIAHARRQQVGTGDRSERVRTYQLPQG